MHICGAGIKEQRQNKNLNQNLICQATALPRSTFITRQNAEHHYNHHEVHLTVVICTATYKKTPTCTPSCSCWCSAVYRPCCTSPARWRRGQSPFCSPGCCGPSPRSNRSPQFLHPSNVRQMLRKKKHYRHGYLIQSSFFKINTHVVKQVSIGSPELTVHFNALKDWSKCRD